MTGYFLLLILVFPFFFFGGPDYYSSRSLNELWNLGHFFFFGLSVFLLDSYWCLKHRSIFFRIVASCIFLIFAGLTIELIQLGMADRSFAWRDIVVDFSGGVAVLLWRIRVGSAFKVVSIVILFFNCIPLAETGIDEYRAYRDFPLIGSFESTFEFGRWEGDAELSRDSGVSKHGKYSGRIGLTTNQYSGISLHHFPRDWSGRSGLAFDVFNPGLKITLHYRVHDDLHDGDMQMYENRYNGRTVLDSGWNEIVIPMIDILHGPRERVMDLTKIRGFGVFVVRQKERRVLYLDDVRLF